MVSSTSTFGAAAFTGAAAPNIIITEAIRTEILLLFFCRMILKEEISVDDLFAAIGKLEIISITLDPGDNAQLIFESLNSTGLALTEGDKIRNYILMGLSPHEQNSFFDTYWLKIEKCTAGDVSGFVRDYLSIKKQLTPTINNAKIHLRSIATLPLP